MKVLRGYSEEVANNKWSRADVEVTEEDLLTMMAELELPESMLKSLSIHDKFMLLEAEAEICLLGTRVMAGISTSETIAKKLASFKTVKDKILTELKASHVPF